MQRATEHDRRSCALCSKPRDLSTTFPQAGRIDTAPIPPADQAAGNQDGRLGFRTPCLIVSPFARREFVSHQLLDHTSVLKMIEWRWGLAPLTVRDQGSSDSHVSRE